MSNDLAILECSLLQLKPHFEQALARTMPVERLIRTIVISVEKTPKLLAADRQTFLNGIMTFAVLGLEVDGATGQGFLVPFRDNKRGIMAVQPIIGYKGYNTLGARSGLTIGGGVVREGDEFEYSEGSRAFVHHKRKLGGEKDRKIIAAWATATSNTRPAIVKTLSIDELNAIKAKSPRGSEPPWADHTIGFPAMCEKSAKRRLARDMPLNVFQQASRMEEAHEEQGKLSWIDPNRGVQIDGEFHDGPQINHDQRSTDELLAPRGSAAPASSAPSPAGAADDLAEDLMAWDSKLATAAMQGEPSLAAEWGRVPRHLKRHLVDKLDTIHKPNAAKAAI